MPNSLKNREATVNPESFLGEAQKLQTAQFEERIMILRAQVSGLRQDLVGLLSEMDRVEVRTRKPVGRETTVVLKKLVIG